MLKTRHFFSGPFKQEITAVLLSSCILTTAGVCNFFWISSTGVGGDEVQLVYKVVLSTSGSRLKLSERLLIPASLGMV